MTINNLKPALELWDNGFNVIPINSTEIPPSPGSFHDKHVLYKRPFVSWKPYQKHRASREEVCKWYEERPYLNIGIITDGLLVVDADNEEAVDWCRDNLSDEIYSITAKGEHYYFKQSINLKIKNTVIKRCGIDIRADGGFVVAPPSVHGSGINYSWSTSFTPKLDGLLEMSIEEFEFLKEHLSLNEKCTSPHRNPSDNLSKNRNSPFS